MATRIQTHNIPITYIVNGAMTSPLFGKAFAKGCGGVTSNNAHHLIDNDVAMFGHPDLFNVLRQAQTQGKNWYYGDKAYFGRNTYYRVTKNAYMHRALHGNDDAKRWNRLNIPIIDWQQGSDILLCPQSDVHFRLHGTTQSKWIKRTTEDLKQHTDRKIRVHYKNSVTDTETAFKRQLKNVWAVVVYSSMSGVQATVHGVPCFATEPYCTSASFGTTDLSLIESPIKPDNRLQMVSILANNQWTLTEINSKLAWEAIK